MLDWGYSMKDSYQQLRSVVPENDVSEIEPVQEVFMRMPAGNGSDELVFRIPLLPDGSADVSQVPSQLRTSWEEVGERSPVDVGNLPPVFIKPKDGARFLATLLRRRVTASGVWFSSSSTV